MNTYVIHKQSMIRYLSHFIPRVCKVELLEPDTHYVLDYVKSGEHENEDSEEYTDRFGIHLGHGSYHITYESTESDMSLDFILKYLVMDNHPPVESRMTELNALFPEYMKIESQTEINTFEAQICKFIEKARISQFKYNSDQVMVLRWSPSGEYWKREGTIPKRTFNSIILDNNIEDELFQDLNDFVSSETRDFYLQHCIPFRRAYLLHGKPGTGKSSIIHGIASKLDRAIYRINLVAPKLCDDSLQQAIREVSKKGIIVFEDIDALFGVHREKTEISNVTFSGLLNALDGFATNTKGVLIIFTTNHPEKLDPALRRKGRIDREFEIKPCNQNQAERMFLRFYPNCEKSAKIFAQQAKSYTPAQLQHHFILNRNQSAEQAALFSATMESSSFTQVYS